MIRIGVGLDLIYAVDQKAVIMAAGWTLGTNWGFKMGFEIRTRTGACMIRGLLHIPLGDKRISFDMVTNVSVRKEDALGRRQVGKREERVARIAIYRTREVSDVFQDKCHGFFTLLLRKVGYLDRWLKVPTMFTGQFIEVRAK